MKNIWRLLVAAFLVLNFSSCSDGNDDSSGPSAAVSTSLRSGTWKVVSFVDNGNDETIDYSSFVFTFSNSGTVTAVNNILTVNGTWSTGIDDSKHKLNLNFPNSSVLTELTEDWEIVSNSSTTVSLRHISGGNGEVDLLVFQKV